VSTADQADKGYSLPTQIDACQRLAQQEGYTVLDTHIFVDDYTGTSLNRPQFTKLRDLVRQRLVQAVFVYDLDRLSRKLAHQLLLSDEFEQAGVALHIITMPNAAKTPEMQLLVNMRGIIAEYERAKLLERTARGRRGRAQAGHVPQGRCPLGYTYIKHASQGAHYEVHPEEAALVQRIFQLYVEGGRALDAIAALLTQEGIPTPADHLRTLPARVWHRSTIGTILRNTAYIETLYDGKTQNLLANAIRTKKHAIDGYHARNGYLSQCRLSSTWTCSRLPRPNCNATKSRPSATASMNISLSAAGCAVGSAAALCSARWGGSSAPNIAVLVSPFKMW
jgi:site-specific DNA recombinase